MGKIDHRRRNLNPLTKSFDCRTLAAWTQCAGFLINTNMVFETHAEAKNYLIFSAITFLHQKGEKWAKYEKLMLGTYGLSG